MNYLLDTHVFLWTLSEPARLTGKAMEAIQNPNHGIFVSSVTGVEIAIKTALGKLEAPENLEEEIGHRGFSELALRYCHGAFLRSLPAHHQDPFDRMLIAQAMLEDLTLITHDRKFEPYAVKVLWT